MEKGIRIIKEGNMETTQNEMVLPHAIRHQYKRQELGKNWKEKFVGRQKNVGDFPLTDPHKRENNLGGGGGEDYDYINYCCCSCSPNFRH